MTDPQSKRALPPFDETNAQLSVLGRIPESHPVRAIALSVARGEPVSAIQPLIDALLDPTPDRWYIRSAAAWALSRMPLTDEQTDAATASLMDVLELARPEPWHNRFARAIKRHVVITFGGGALATLLILAFLAIVSPYAGPPSLSEVFWIMTALVGSVGMPFTLPASFLFDRGRDSNARGAAAEALGRLGQPESVGALAAALWNRSPWIREASAAALHRVLPLLREEHYGMFGAESITNLSRALNHPDAQLVAKTLAALNVVGTSHAIPFVSRLAKNGRTVRLRDAAAEVLAALEARQRTETRNSTLLRATVSPDDPSRVLVRSSSEAVATANADVLLRISGEADG